MLHNLLYKICVIYLLALAFSKLIAIVATINIIRIKSMFNFVTVLAKLICTHPLGAIAVLDCYNKSRMKYKICLCKQRTNS